MPAEINHSTQTPEGVPEKVFSKFLKRLQESGLDSGMISALKKTLMEDRVFSEARIKQALLTNSETK